jgi:hypothetical protein
MLATQDAHGDLSANTVCSRLRRPRPAVYKMFDG